MVETLTIDKNELADIVNCAGQVRGIVLLTDAEYVRRNHGEEALSRVEAETENMGYPLEYTNIKTMHWYPVGFRVVSLLAIRKVLQLSDNNLTDMGRKALKNSLITKLMLRYFINLDTLLSRLQSYWDKNYSVGIISSKREGNTLFLCLEDCQIPRLLLPYLEGYFLAVIGMIIGGQKQIRMEEYWWKHKNGTCYEFVIKW